MYTISPLFLTLRVGVPSTIPIHNQYPGYYKNIAEYPSKVQIPVISPKTNCNIAIGPWLVGLSALKYCCAQLLSGVFPVQLRSFPDCAHGKLFGFDFAHVLFQFDGIFHCWLNYQLEFFYQLVYLLPKVNNIIFRTCIKATNCDWLFSVWMLVLYHIFCSILQGWFSI